MVEKDKAIPYIWSDWIPNTQTEDKIPTVLVDMPIADWECRLIGIDRGLKGNKQLDWSMNCSTPVTTYRYKIYYPLTGYAGVDADVDNVLPEGLLETSRQEDTSSHEWTNKHYNFWYRKHITDYEMKSGYVNIKVDPYFVNKLWGLNNKDDTGVLFHQLKTLSRFGDKNSVEREIKALHGQVVRLAELHNVELGDK